MWVRKTLIRQQVKHLWGWTQCINILYRTSTGREKLRKQNIIKTFTLCHKIISAKSTAQICFFLIHAFHAAIATTGHLIQNETLCVFGSHWAITLPLSSRDCFDWTWTSILATEDSGHIATFSVYGTSRHRLYCGAGEVIVTIIIIIQLEAQIWSMLCDLFLLPPGLPKSSHCPICFTVKC